MSGPVNVDAVEAPTACPFCQSPQIAVPNDKVISKLTYWRCESCNQLWNIRRPMALDRPSRWNRY